MIKLSVLLRKLPHLSHEEFLRIWLEEHGPIVRRNAAARRIRRYVQLHPLAGAFGEETVRRRGGRVAAVDGIAELWWDSPEDMLAANSTEEGRRAANEIVEHERQFLDLPNLEFYFSQEHEFISGR